MILNIVWTVLVFVGGFAGMAAIPVALSKLQDVSGFWPWIVAIIGFTIAVLPAWFMWKGTKLIPLITNIPFRIMMIVAVYAIAFVGVILGGIGLQSLAWICTMISAIAIVAFSLIGIWLK